MKVALYENGTSDTGKKLQSIIMEQIQEDCFEIFHTIDDLALQLRKPMNRISITILLATTRQELKYLVTLQDLLEDIQIILVLPDRRVENLTLGLHLRTSYISDMDSNLSDVASVFQKIIKKGIIHIIKEEKLK